MQWEEYLVYRQQVVPKLKRRGLLCYLAGKRLQHGRTEGRAGCRSNLITKIGRAHV